mgnify:CR=1 FL=1
MNTNVNISTCRKFILETEMRASKDSILLLQAELKRHAETIAALAKEKALSSNNKTILDDHMKNAISELSINKTKREVEDEN